MGQNKARSSVCVQVYPCSPGSLDVIQRFLLINSFRLSSGLFVDLIVTWVVNSLSAPLTMDLLQGPAYTAGAAPCSCWAQHCNTLLTCCEHIAGNLLQWERSSCFKMSKLKGQTGILHSLQFRSSPRINRVSKLLYYY